MELSTLYNSTSGLVHPITKLFGKTTLYIILWNSQIKGKAEILELFKKLTVLYTELAFKPISGGHLAVALSWAM